MNLKSLVAELARGIQADSKRCGALLPLLEQQQRRLAATDAEGLADVGAKIDLLLAELRDSARSRVRCLAELGLSADQRGMRTLIDKMPASLSRPMLDSWQALETSLAQCKALNERNGELLASQRAILSELTGRATTSYGEPD